MAELSIVIPVLNEGASIAETLQALAPYRARGDLIWTRSQPSLEDVFIDLMGKAKDNFQ